VIRVGLVLPSFRFDAETALDTARRADEAGLDGVFVYDHLFPMGDPARPAISCFPLLGAVAAATTNVTVGPFVARVGLVPDAMLVNQLQTLARIAPGRVIGALGTGDRKSAPEHDIYHLAFQSVADRVGMLRDCCRRLHAVGVPAWVGGTSDAVRRVAVEEHATLNMWAVGPAEVAAAVAGGLEVTWGGPPPNDVEPHLAGLGEAGATWAVMGPPPSVDWPATVERLAAARHTVNA
jgi:alkanesulfonate monooxygenase SsuD/methylene tetrahydromethanopterin reductase-like flavin-dependent oxidoreductase (luciferase family)